MSEGHRSDQPPKRISQLIKDFNKVTVSPSQTDSQTSRPTAQVPPTQRLTKPFISKKPIFSKPPIPNELSKPQQPKPPLPSPEVTPASEASIRKSPGKTVQILKIHSDTFDIDTTAFTEVLEKVPDLPIVIISINGSSREGKSYVLNYFIRYFKSQGDPNWFHQDLSGEDLFSWRSGRERETVGINLYTETFITNQDNREVAVLLLDCQGLFDQHTTFQQNAVIYALSNLLSSVMIYNVQCKVEENLLQNIQYFSSYAKAISTEDAIEEELPHFMFLLRDFSFFAEYEYGFHSKTNSPPSADTPDGSNYFEDTMSLRTDMPVENQSVRSEILSSYSDVGMFLMPFPGKAFVQNSLANPPDADFQEFLQQFILLMTSSEHLVTKKIGGVEVSGKQLKDYIQIWGEECAASATMFPEARTIGDSTILHQNEVAANNAFASYKQNFSKFIHSEDSGVSDEELQKYHADLVSYALAYYKASRKLGAESIVQSYSQKIEALCENVFQENYFPMNAEIRKRNLIAEQYAVNQAATEAYIRKMQYQIQQLQQNTGETGKLKEALASKQLESQRLLEDRIEIKSRLQADIGNAMPQLAKHREFFAGVKDSRFSVKKVRITKQLYLHELEKAKKERDELEQEEDWDDQAEDFKESIYAQPYEDVPVGTRGTYRVLDEDGVASKLAQEEKEKVREAKLRAATRKIQSLVKKIEELENASKQRSRKKPWWQFW